MPLPADPNQLWPPQDAMTADIACWSAWYSGAADRLAASGVPVTGDRATRTLGGFWRKRQAEPVTAQQVRVVHVPLAAEVAAVGADLLFGDTPELACDTAEAQESLNSLVAESAVQNSLLEGAEVAAGMGGVYLRASWDEQAGDEAYLLPVHPDRAVPDFRGGRLRAVTFWEVVAASEGGNVVWRHLERHEPKVILHGLYQGTQSSLGALIPLNASEATAGLEPLYQLPAEMPRDLLVSYVPNVLPNRTVRGSRLGRADFAGSELLLEALDEAYSSWMRDIQVAKARILVPRGALDPGGRGKGKGKTFDLDAAVFTELQLDPAAAGGNISQVQFAIRSADHAATCQDLVERIVSGSGYSPATFGIGIDGKAESGTALHIREARTAHTVARKQRYWAPAVCDQLENMLAIERFILGRSDVTVERPSLKWHEETQGPLEQAQTLELLARAEAISIQRRVELAQPELDEAQLAEEVQRIKDDGGRSLPDPFQDGLVP